MRRPILAPTVFLDHVFGGSRAASCPMTAPHRARLDTRQDSDLTRSRRRRDHPWRAMVITQDPIVRDRDARLSAQVFGDSSRNSTARPPFLVPTRSGERVIPPLPSRLG